MKVIQVLFSSFLFSMFIFSCNNDISNTTIVGSKNIITETRDVSTFSKVEVEDAIKAQIQQGNKSRVEVRANDNLMGKIVTEVINGTLHVKYRGHVNTKNTVFFQNGFWSCFLFKQ